MIDYKRWRIDNLRDALNTRRVVVISGARQTGKTTLARHVLSNESIFMPLDKIEILSAAQDDPAGFIKNNTGTMVIDEIQKAPLLIPEIKFIVDHDNRPGQYLLTGSIDITSLPDVSESMAGRIKNLRLRPLTVGETQEKLPNFIARAFSGDFPKIISGYDKKAILSLALRGGYPEVIRLNKENDRKDWHKDYLDTLIKRDLKDVANIKRQDVLRNLVGILAAWSGKFMDMTRICSTLGLSKPTIESYINALESMYLFEKVAPWTRTDYERVGRRHKLYATDTGFMSAVLGYKSQDILLDKDRSGKLIETFVFQELIAQVDLDNQYALFQYRDRKDREIDFLIERDDGALVGIEVKAGHTVSKDDFNHQIWFRDHIIRGTHPYQGIVLYSGEHTLSFGPDLLAVPTAALWL